MSEVPRVHACGTLILKHLRLHKQGVFKRPWLPFGEYLASKQKGGEAYAKLLGKIESAFSQDGGSHKGFTSSILLLVLKVGEVRTNLAGWLVG